MSGDTKHLSSEHKIVCQNEAPKSEMDLEFTHQKESDLEGIVINFSSKWHAFSVILLHP